MPVSWDIAYFKEYKVFKMISILIIFLTILNLISTPPIAFVFTYRERLYFLITRQFLEVWLLLQTPYFSTHLQKVLGNEFNIDDICNDTQLDSTSTHFIRVYIMWKIILSNNKTVPWSLAIIAYTLLQYTSIHLHSVIHNNEQL